MRKRVISSIGILLMLLIVTSVYNPVSAKTYAVGVKVGDTADYAVGLTYPADAATMHISVYGIVGTVVTLDVSYIFKNGSHSASSQVQGDIATGAGAGIWIYLIARNLTTNDPVWSGSADTINNIGSMTAGGAARTVCHMNFSGWYGGDIWWDQQTGIVVKSNLRMLFYWYNFSLTSTSLWSAGLFGLSWTELAIIGVGAVVLIAVIAIVLRRRH